VRVAPTGRDGNPLVLCLESTLDAGGLPIQAVEVSASHFLRSSVFFASTRYSISIIAVGSDQM